MKQLDIHSGMGGNAAILSNLHPKPFIMDGLYFASIEGFLQGLRVQNPDRQKEIFMKSGIPAKVVGRTYPIKNNTLYYKGKPFNRYSDFYQELLDRAYKYCFFQCDAFYNAIKETVDCEYIHTIGKNDKSQTILTNDEFLSRLNKFKILFYGKTISEAETKCHEKLLIGLINLKNNLNCSHATKTSSAYC